MILISGTDCIPDDRAAMLKRAESKFDDLGDDLYSGIATDEADAWQNIKTLSESLFDVTQRLTLDDEEWGAVDLFLDALGRAVATKEIEALDDLRQAERTEWAVIVLTWLSDLDTSGRDPDPLHPNVMDATLTAMYEWLQTEKSTPCGKISAQEQAALREVIIEVYEQVTAPDARRIDLTPRDSRPHRKTSEWPDPENPGEVVDPLAVRDYAVEIASKEDPSGPEHANVKQIAALYTYVRDRIEYVSDPQRNYVAPPDRTLEIGGGDCDCQAVAAASLFEAIGASTYLAEVHSNTGGIHLLPLVELGTESEQEWTTDQLIEFHEEEGVEIDRFGWYNDDLGLVFLADPVIGRYIGDRHQLAEAGYVIEHESGWEWYEEPVWYHPQV